MSRRRLTVRETAARPVIVDASIAVQWFVSEPGSARAARLIDEHWILLAPDIILVEAANAWWKKVRRGEISVADFEQAVVCILSMGLVLQSTAPLLQRAARLAVEVQQSVYDCVYLALSTERDGALATADGRLRRSAERLGVRIWRADH